MIQKKIVATAFLIAFWVLGAMGVMAQNVNPSNLTSSPYSRYGLGKLGSSSNASLRGMGETGIALRTNSYTNLLNPASLTAIDTLTMLFDTAVDADMFRMSENGVSESDWNAGFSYMSFHFPLWNRFAGALAYSPYSMVGYEYGNETSKHIDNSLINNDTLVYTNSFLGNGGLQHFQAALAWQPLRTRTTQLNFGLMAGYICGTVNHAGYMFVGSGQANSTYVDRDFSVHGWDIQLGAQYSQLLSPSKMLTFGATFSPSTALNTKTSVLKYSGTDSIGQNNTGHLDMKTPMKYGFGICYQQDRRLTVSADMSMENWSKVSGFDSNLNESEDAYNNVMKLSAGFEYKPQFYSVNYFKTCLYRAGASFKNVYVKPNGSKDKEMTVSCGIGLPAGKRSIFNISAAYTHLMPSDSNRLKEDYLHFTVGITFNEMMFFRGRLR
ncbi:MAG: hypothetical protein KBT20_07435 [Bacteroidales bacterium]|nr:hypothetical protein [Candidatus Liminaster caballi]